MMEENRVAESLSPAMPAWKLKAFTADILFNRGEPVTQKPCFRRALFISCSFLVLLCRCTSAEFGFHGSVHHVDCSK